MHNAYRLLAAILTAAGFIAWHAVGDMDRDDADKEIRCHSPCRIQATPGETVGKDPKWTIATHGGCGLFSGRVTTTPARATCSESKYVSTTIHLGTEG